MGFELMTSAIPVQYFTNCAMKRHVLEADQVQVQLISIIKFCEMYTQSCR